MFGITSWSRQLRRVSLHSGGRSHGATASPASEPSQRTTSQETVESDDCQRVLSSHPAKENRGFLNTGA